MDANQGYSQNFQEGEFKTDQIKGDILLITWKGFCDSENYQYGFLKAIEITREKGIQKWLLNFLDIKVISPENQKWTAETLIKKINKAEIKKIAVVDPACPLASASVQCIYENFQPLVTYQRKVFKSKEKAEEWLKEVK